MSSTKDVAPKKDTILCIAIPEILSNDAASKQYTRGRFLGKGGFAKCYEITDHGTKQTLAGKIVPKALLVKPHQKQKMTQEICLHRSLNHPHVVGFHEYFEDKDFVYIVLELCKRRSLMELYKRRRAITEPETRYYMRQILLGVIYLHENKIIHRDIKLGNLFLSNDMEVKIGDFGLATKIDFDGERKKTLCGTPNYIAPEVLGKKGHSFEVDTWSLGCVLYTLLVGKPPFETSSLKETYSRIKKNEYMIPPHISPSARNLIKRMLCNEPSQRPSAKESLESDFFKAYIPHRLPTTCLTMEPRFPEAQTQSQRKPLQDVNASTVHTSLVQASGGKKPDQMEMCNNDSPDFHMSELSEQLKTLIDSISTYSKPVNMDEAEDPAASPVLWISKWVDYTDKYGLSYQLCDNSNGVLFNDSTRILLYANGEQVEYIDRDMAEFYYTTRSFPDTLVKKVTLLKYFRNYMSEHLLKAGASMAPKEGDQYARLPFLRTWFRTRSAIILHLSNGTLQINFFEDHTKIILCPRMGAVTYIDNERRFRTYRLSLLEKFGCCRQLAHRLNYARTMLAKLMIKAPTAGVKDRTVP